MVIEDNQQAIQVEVEHENAVLDDLENQQEKVEELAEIASVLTTKFPEEDQV